MPSSYSRTHGSPFLPSRNKRRGRAISFTAVVSAVGLVLLGLLYLSLTNSTGLNTCRGTQTVVAKPGDVLSDLVSKYVGTTLNGYSAKYGEYRAKQMNGGRTHFSGGQTVRLPKTCTK